MKKVKLNNVGYVVKVKDDVMTGWDFRYRSGLRVERFETKQAAHEYKRKVNKEFRYEFEKEANFGH